MRKFYILLAASCMLAACSKEDNSGTGPGEDDGTIFVTLPDIEVVESRAALSLNQDGSLVPSWEKGDVLLVGGEPFTLVSVNGRTGRFSGNLPSAGSFDIVYEHPSAHSSSGPVVQKSDGDISHLHFSASLLGVSYDRNVVFSHEWASAHGGTMSRSGCLQLVLNLPETAVGVASVKCDFGDGNEMSLNVTDGALSNHSFTAWFPADRIVLDNAKQATITVTGTDNCVYTNSFRPDSQEIGGGYVIKFITGSHAWSWERAGKGSEADPYIISSVDDFKAIKNRLAEGTYTWFKLGADLDLSGAGSLNPVNTENAPYGIVFDGDGHKLSNFKSTAGTLASIFGRLHGTVRNLIIENPQVITSSTSPCGIVAGWVGSESYSLQGRLENVHVTGGKVSASGKAIIGGLSGRAGAAVFENCSYDGIVERTNVSTYSSSAYLGIGGIIGQAMDLVTISNCSCGGSLVSKSGRAVGGFLGQTVYRLDITDCTSTMSIETRDDVVGGLVGYYGNGTISGCSVNADIKMTGTSASGSYMGGLVGYATGATVLDGDRYNGTLTPTKTICGGIAGQLSAGVGRNAITRCHSSGKINGISVTGGILGRSSQIGIEISDCSSTMDISATGTVIGGLAGDLPTKSVVRRCFANGTIVGNYAIGGLFGRAFGRQGSSASLDTDVETTIEDCIAYNPSVKTTQSARINPSTTYSGGVIVGCSSRPNTLRNCWRSASVVFDYYNVAALNELFDHADSSPETPLVQPWTTYKWFSPYHGKAAAAGQSASAVAKAIGWSEEVWDLTGSIPELK